jgi:hypothetical protein
MPNIVAIYFNQERKAYKEGSKARVILKTLLFRTKPLTPVDLSARHFLGCALLDP